MPRRKVVEEDSVKMKVPHERRPPSKMKLILEFELLTAVVRPQREVSNRSMLIVPVVVGVDLENCLDKMSDLLIALVQI